MFSDPDLAKSCMFDSFHLVDLYSTSEDKLLSYKKAAFAAMVLKQGIYRNFKQWFSDRVNLVVEFIKKDYISYADAAFFYMLKLDDNQDLLETIKKSNPQLKQIAMSVAERLIQEGEQKGILIGEQKGRQKGIRIGKEKGKLEGKLEISKSMLSKGYSIEDIVLITGLYPSDIQSIS